MIKTKSFYHNMNERLLNYYQESKIISNQNFRVITCFVSIEIYFLKLVYIIFQLLLKMRREMRNKMEHDIQTIQDQLINEQDSTSFRQIDADNMRKEFQLATFKSTKF